MFRLAFVPSRPGGEAGHPEFRIVEVHDDPTFRTSGFMGTSQKLKPRPAIQVHTSRCAVTNDVAVPVKVCASSRLSLIRW
jgi:hypothetical protein